jgi:hypothetical protein
MKEEFEKLVGNLAEYDDPNWWFEKLGWWVTAWRAGVGAFKAELKDELMRRYLDEDAVNVGTVLGMIDDIRI